jgi:hypothetical protein
MPFINCTGEMDASLPAVSSFQCINYGSNKSLLRHFICNSSWYGELTRTYLLKRVDISIWLSFCAAAVPPIAFLSTIRHACSVDNSEGHVPASGLLAWEILTWVSVAAIPILAIILAKFVTHGYVERYALPRAHRSRADHLLHRLPRCPPISDYSLFSVSDLRCFHLPPRRNHFASPVNTFVWHD